MPPRSKVHSLPSEVRDELNARLIGNGFGGYEDLAGWLSSQGYSISKTALHRYGSDLQQSFEQAMADVRRSTELAKALNQSAQDDEASLTDATVRIAQESLLRVTIALREAEDDPSNAAPALAKISRALADLGRVGIAQRKWQAEVRAKAEAVAARAEKIASKGGLSAEAVAEIRREILGVAG